MKMNGKPNLKSHELTFHAEINMKYARREMESGQYSQALSRIDYAIKYAEERRPANIPTLTELRDEIIKMMEE